ncbi:hypothetical protein SAMN04489864_10180 [Pedobacter insulae]|uniref:Uncharacterized protein n=1 Tax=Pedobacter insulae TaxID=414048 RepID=A0A1I2SW35_9SPHI|nr:hypothetical protein SAMN04489864_10180 [Pedobacter insulae]
MGYINPQLNLRNLVSFSGERHALRLAESNLIFGLSYKIK